MTHSTPEVREGTDALALRLEHLGFRMTGLDLKAGRIDLAEVVHRLRRDAPKHSEPSCASALALARELERGMTIRAARASIAASEDMDWGYVLVDEHAPTAEIALTKLIEQAPEEWGYRFTDQDRERIPLTDVDRRWFRWDAPNEELVPCEAEDPARDSEWWCFDLSLTCAELWP